MVSTHSVTLLSEGHAATGNSCIAEHEKRCPPIAHPRRCAPGAHGRPHYRTPWAHHGGHSSSARGQGSRPAGQRPMQATGQAVPCGHGLAYEARRTNARVPCALPRHRLRAAMVGLRNSVWTCELKRVVMSLWTAGGGERERSKLHAVLCSFKMDGAARAPSTGLRTTHKSRHWSAAAPAAPPPHALLPSFGAANSRQPCSR